MLFLIFLLLFLEDLAVFLTECCNFFFYVLTPSMAAAVVRGTKFFGNVKSCDLILVVWTNSFALSSELYGHLMAMGTMSICLSH